MHPLDRPVWASLTGAHAPLSVGGALARRYRPDVNRFAATPDDGPEALAALAALLAPGESAFLAQVPALVVPPGLRVAKQGLCVQMLATRALRDDGGPDALLRLGEPDAAEMLALATLTEPGPFLPRTHAMGDFLGVRRPGRLLAMAGERFRVPGYAEVSGVCTHPEARGLGLARRLSAAVAARIQARGEQPFLHAWETNTPAIALYETLGFRVRTKVHVAVLERLAG
ncbi:GNAT family N-acetyltransferase [Hydrogenophaga borbori]|uniref:GNAT family N-acetyltransferase n=1 Tax=Hydrogenophaga borbori TaxID=2294117 RepID=A0A372EQ96_9BURK|nr:GNAT family N-acetyltransferase [Hydrogenophaga borbori]RFP82799.1 GNAT family N-acetyltransferase [Hydrogenophaga borbori]